MVQQLLQRVSISSGSPSGFVFERTIQSGTMRGVSEVYFRTGCAAREQLNRVKHRVKQRERVDRSVECLPYVVAEKQVIALKTQC